MGSVFMGEADDVWQFFEGVDESIERYFHTADGMGRFDVSVKVACGDFKVEAVSVFRPFGW